MSQSGKLLTFWILLALLFSLLASVANAAGGVGHFYIAKRSAEKLKYMVEADELGVLLREPSCLNAFCNGAIAPDLACLVAKAHYGQTTELPQRLINQAEDAWEAAAKLPASDPKRAGKLKEAEKAMAFGLGWLSHCAVDLAIHPKVNAQCGDIYEFLDSGGKAKHAAMEIQFTAYLTKSLRKPEDKIAFDIPYWLVSSVSGISQKELEGSVKVMRGKLVAEVAAANQVQLTVSMLRSDWQSIVDKCLADTIDFILNPEHMEDWDLDCGRISTEDFHGLRAECLEITGGVRPADWGKNYLNWWEQVRYLSAEQRHQWLVELLQGERTYQPGRKEVLVRTDGNQKLWVNGKEMKYPGNNVVQVPSSGVLTLQVLLYQTYRYICTDHKYRGDNVNIITENPFELHYTSTLYGGPYEHRTMMVKEAYTWKAYDNPGTVKNSGAHPNLIGDVFEWKVPTVRNVYGDSKTFTINIECQSEWYQYELHGNPPEVYLDSNPHMLLMIEVEEEQ